MKTLYILNIGLGNNPMKKIMPSILSDYSKENNGFTFHLLRYAKGSYKGEEETTLVAHGFDYTDNPDSVKRMVKIMAMLFHQDCIAMMGEDGHGDLIYNPLFKGKKLEFDKELFIV